MIKLVSFRGAETGAEIWINPETVNAVAEVDDNLAQRFPEAKGGTVVVINNRSLTLRDKPADVVKKLEAAT